MLTQIWALSKENKKITITKFDIKLNIYSGPFPVPWKGPVKVKGLSFISFTVNPPLAVNNARTDDKHYVAALSLFIIKLIPDTLITYCVTLVCRPPTATANHIHSLTAVNRTVITQS
jgi:hypothetical protein